MAQGINFRSQDGVRAAYGGIAALSFPTLLVVVALGADFRAIGDGSDFATALLATVLFVIAAPTAWIFSIDFIEAGRFTVVFVSVITSFPLWYFIGSRLARVVPSWPSWITSYLKICILWTVLWMLLIQLFALWA
jgi:hypothetical protein